MTGRNNRNTGTWSEVVYLLLQRARFCRSRAAKTADAEIAHLLLLHSEVCKRAATKLHWEIKRMAK